MSLENTRPTSKDVNLILTRGAHERGYRDALEDVIKLLVEGARVCDKSGEPWIMNTREAKLLANEWRGELLQGLTTTHIKLK